jgi:hypothetical protein
MREDHGLGVLQNRALRKIFGGMRDGGSDRGLEKIA